MQSLWRSWFSIPFWQRVVGAFIVGAALGALAPDIGVSVKPAGDLFIKAIKMLVAPLIFCALVSAITEMAGARNSGRLGAKTVGLFLLTAIIASVIGLTLGTLLLSPPAAPLQAAADFVPKQIPALSEVFLNLIPSNPFAALAEGNVLQIVVFAVLVGVAINAVGSPAQGLKQALQGGAQVMYRMTKLVLELTPLGVFGLMAWVVGSYGLDSLLPLASFVGVIYLACLIHIIVVYGFFVYRFGGISPWQFFKAVFSAQVVAYTTCSSFGSLPVAHQTVTQKLGVSERYASFVLPLGSTINMDGCGGIYPAVAAIFIAHLYGIDLSVGQYLLITATATLASIGTAGVPGTAMVMLTVTLNAVGLPLEGIAFIAAIDRIIDMMRTATNVTGDMMVALVVGRSEGEVDEARLQQGIA